jgi:hypothetical protein
VHTIVRIWPIDQLCDIDPAINSAESDTGRLIFACPEFPDRRGAPSVPTPRVKIGFVNPCALCNARAAFILQELCEKTPPQHGCILVGADNGALQNDRGGARHREKFGLVLPQPLAGAARSGCGVSRNARHTGQLLSRARGIVRKAGERSTRGV